MSLEIRSVLDELKGQRWLLWYRLCCCTVVSSQKYPYRGRVRNRKTRRKYDELRETVAETEMLLRGCVEMMERTR